MASIVSSVGSGSGSSSSSGTTGRIVDPSLPPFNAVGNGTTNDQVALSNALATLVSGDTLLINAGKVYAHSGVLSLTTPGVTVRGGGTLRATSQTTSAFKVTTTAHNCTIDGVTFELTGRTSRGSSGDHHKLVIDRNTGFIGRRIRIVGSHAVGIFVFGATDYLLDAPVVSNTAADGIHQTFGAQRGLVRDPLVIAPEDDGVAVVSYVADGQLCQDIVVTGAVVRNQAVSGRGLTCVGGTRVRFTDFEVDGSYAAAAMAACEAGWNTYACTDVKFEQGRINNANTGAPVLQHGAVLNVCDNPGRVNTGVVFRDITITNTDVDAPRIIGLQSWNGGTTTNALVEDIRIEQATANPSQNLFVDTAAVTYRATRITRNGTAV